jgi:class 3 adenylate cyclase
MHSAEDGVDLERSASIDELLDRAVAAINQGDRGTATALAGQVLAVDGGNFDAEDLLTAPDGGGELRRLTIFFADLVDSTALSTQVEPEVYRTVVGRYRDHVTGIVASYEGHIASTKGDGLLAVFGHPIAHEDDVRRAVQAGLDVTHRVTRLSDQARARFGIEVSVRVGIHRGIVYLDTAQDDVYGLAANLAARVSGLAPPGTLVVSEPVERLIRNDFDMEVRPPAPVKGIKEPIAHYRVLGVRTAASPTGQGPVVGRERELGYLRNCWSRARVGALTMPPVVFRGEAGIGKSRLAGAAAELARQDGALVLELAGTPLHPDAGLHPVRTLIERRCGIGRSSERGERLRLLEREIRASGLDPEVSIPLLAPVLGIGAEGGYEPVAAEGQKLYGMVSAAVVAYLSSCLGATPALLVAEDAHWFDPSTMEVLGSLLATAGGGLMVVVTGRPSDWLPADWSATVFDLGPLTAAETDELMAALQPGLSAKDRAKVAGRCDGVPFYIEEVLAGLNDTGVPETLYEPLFARIRTSPNAVPVVEAAAIIGREFDADLLHSILDLSRNSIDQALNELKDVRVLEPRTNELWRFRHELLREVAVELAPPSLRRKLNAEVADSLTNAGDPDWQVVATYYERAERFESAASAYRMASTEARRRGALNEAHTYLTQAVQQLSHCPPSAGRDRREIAARLERGLLVSAAEGYQSPAASADFECCLQLGGTDLRDDELFATMIALCAYYTVRGDLPRVVQIAESLSGALEERESFRPVIDTMLGMVAFRRGDFRDARRRLERAQAGLAKTNREKLDVLWRLLAHPLAYTQMHLGLTYLMQGDLLGASNLLAHIARDAEGLSFPRGPYCLMYARSLQTWIHVEAGQIDLAALRADELCDRAKRHGFDLWRLEGDACRTTVRALVAVRAADDPETTLPPLVDELAQLLDTLRSKKINRMSTFYDAMLGRLLITAGRPKSARTRIDAGLQFADDTGMRFYNAELLRLRAHTQPDPAKVEADLHSALNLARSQGAALFELRTALDYYQLSGAPARAALLDAVAGMPNGSALPELARAQTALG